MIVYRQWLVWSAFGVLVASAPARADTDPVDVTNAVRSTGCGKTAGIDQPFQARQALDAAAQRIAGGDGLETAISDSDYRARRSASIHMRTKKGDADVARMLGQRFCDLVTDSSLRDIGAHRKRDEIWIVLAAPLALQGGKDASTVTARMLELVNETRSGGRSCGRRKFAAAGPLRRDAALERAALAHAQDMAAHSNLGHEGSDGGMPADRATRAGYTWRSVAENVAAGQTTADEVVATWLASPGHCENLMNPRYTDTGLAFAVAPASEKGIYWVQIFAAPE